MRGCGHCCSALLLSLFVKGRIRVWSVSSVLRSRRLKHTKEDYDLLRQVV